MSELKIIDFIYSHFFFLFFFILFIFLFLNLELEVGVMSHICYMLHDTVTSHGHMIIYHEEHYKKFQNNNIVTIQ